MNAEHTAKALLALADIEVNGSNPWDIQIHDKVVYQRVIAQGSVALGETYMEGLWDCERLDQFFEHVISAGLVDKVSLNPHNAWLWLQATVRNLQTKGRARIAIDAHYEETNTRAFEYIYDKSMCASCGYFPNGDEDLDTAQTKKFKLLCDKLGLRPGDHVVDIGCGWGSFMVYATKVRGARCTGITLSVSQAEYIRKRYSDLPITVIQSDYREAVIPEKADHVVSIEMFGHVGRRNFKHFFEVARAAMKDDGIFILQETLRNKRHPTLDPWIDKYIFPNAEAPSPGQAASAAEGLFVLEDFHNLGPMLNKTLMGWQANMERNKEFIIENFGLMWYRMMTYYHTSCAATYSTRIIGCGQFVFSPKGVPGGYRAVR